MSDCFAAVGGLATLRVGDRRTRIFANRANGNLNKAVKRNLNRFPSDFMVRLSQEDVNDLIFQNGTSNAKTGRGGRRVTTYSTRNAKEIAKLLAMLP